MTEKIFYVDGSCQINPGPGGYGVLNMVGSNIYYWYSERYQNTTNNRMELSAVIHVLKLAKKDPTYKYIIYSDSAYVVNICTSWIWKWARNNWTRDRGKSIENIDLIKELYDLLTFSSFEYEIRKCPGHAGILENEVVDAIASHNQVKFNRLADKYNITYIDLK